MHLPPPPHRFTLRDLPLPAKLVLSLFLMAIGLGYIAAMMQLHGKSGSRDGNALPTVKDVVKRYSGADWPLTGKARVEPVKKDEKNGAKEQAKSDAPADMQFVAMLNQAPAEGTEAVKIRTLIKVRCAECHNPEGEKDDILLHEWDKLAEWLKPSPEKSRIHTVLTGPADSWGEKSMVQAFTNKSTIDDEEWKKAFPKLKPEEQKAIREQRDTELQAMLAWVRAGAKKEHYDADKFPLPDALKKRPLTADFAVGAAASEEPSVKKKDETAEPKKEEKGQVAQAAGDGGPLKVKIRTLIDIRCNECHKQEKSDVPLSSFGDLVGLLLPSATEGKMHKVITGPPARWGKDSMVRAFTDKSDGWKVLLKQRGDALKAERENEKFALLAWLEAGAPREAFIDNVFEVPAGKLRGSDFTKELVVGEPDPVPPANTIRQIDYDSLVQSTHAHMLTFAMMWTMTGLIFAFTSYPMWLRLTVAPAVLLAQIVDVLCWWLARLPDVGPYFAIAILGTGAIVGLGVTTQIILSLFNMYGYKGKMTLAFICLFGFAGMGVFFIKYVEPELAAEKAPPPAAVK